MPHPDVERGDPWMAVEEALDKAGRGYGVDANCSPLLAEIRNRLQEAGVPLATIIEATMGAIRQILG